jgi:hypothetical protein
MKRSNLLQDYFKHKFVLVVLILMKMEECNVNILLANSSFFFFLVLIQIIKTHPSAYIRDELTRHLKSVPIFRTLKLQVGMEDKAKTQTV